MRLIRRPLGGRTVGVMTALLGGALLLAATTDSVAATDRLGETQLQLLAGSIVGYDNNSDVRIDELHIDYGHRFRDQLEFLTQLSYYRPSGTRRNVSVDTHGLGLAFALRWHFLQRQSFGLHADWGFGFMGVLDPFPPKGTQVNGTPHYGIGLAARISDRYEILAGLRHRHMSNGKGIVSSNPSFDGVGGYLGIAHSVGYRSPQPALGKSAPFGGKKTRYRMEYIYEDIGESNSPGLRFAYDTELRAKRDLRLMLSLNPAKVADDPIRMADAYVYRETAGRRLAAGYAHQRLDVFTSNFLRLQSEHALDDIALLQFVVGYEWRSHSSNRTVFSAMVTVTPLHSLALRSGITFRRAEGASYFISRNQSRSAHGSQNSETEGKFAVGIEWSPGPLAARHLSLTIDERIGNDAWSIGIRFRPGSARNLSERQRSSDLLPLR